jgi:hypothetical protein
MLTSMRQIGLAALAAFSLIPTGAAAQSVRSGQLNSSSSNQGMMGRCGASSSPSGSCGRGMGASLRSTTAGGYRGTGTSLTNLYGAAVGQANPYASLSASPYSGYGDSYGESEIGGAMRGTADIVGAQGAWLKSLQQADLVKEQGRGTQLLTRRQAFDEYFYERRHTPTFEEERERYAQVDLRRSLNDPPLGEISSGQALNTLLGALGKQFKDTASGPAIALDADVLRHINLAAGCTRAGILKDEGRLSWPPVLRGDRFKTDRDLLSSLAPEAIYQAVNGHVDAGTLKVMANSIQRLRRDLTSKIGDLTASEFIDANRFLAELEDGLKALGRPDADRVFTGKYAARGGTVPELISYMLTHGLTFAPAVAGDGASYVALHRALVAYNNGQKSNGTAKP